MPTLRLFLFLGGLSLLSLLPACSSHSASDLREEEGNLTFDGHSFAVVKPNGKLQPIRGNNFRRGETMALVLHNVRGFEPNEKGRYEYNMDLVVENLDGEVVREETELFGLDHQGPLDSANMAVAPYVFLGIHEHDPKGRYIVIVTMYDNVGGGSVTQQAVISVE